MFNVSTYVAACDKHDDHHFDCFDNDFSIDGIRVNIDDGTITLTNKDDEYETVEFTENYELIVNGDNIDLNQKQQELVEEFYTLSFDLIEEAKKIGLEGAKIGVDGAKLGLSAVANAFRLLSPDYSSEDFERDIERKSEKLEKKAEKLEAKAEKLEVVADHLEDIKGELKQQTPELRDMDWF